MESKNQTRSGQRGITEDALNGWQEHYILVIIASDNYRQDPLLLSGPHIHYA